MPSLTVTLAVADDLYLEGALTSDTYASMGNIITQNSCTVDDGVAVTLETEATVKLRPTTAIKSGGTLTVVTLDDGLPNDWELQYFPDLSQGPTDDYDGDGLNNLAEYNLGLDPSDGVMDSDGDGIPDWWEVINLGGDLSHENDTLNPGDYYIYDARGRMTHFIKVQPR